MTNLFMSGLRKIDAKKATEKAIYNHRSFLIDLNQDQLQEGKTAEGSSIVPLYTRFTKKMKEIKGQPSDRVTLRDTGDFYNKMYGKKIKGGVELTSMDRKTPSLQEKYRARGGIFGVTPKNMEWFVDVITPDVIEEMIRQMER